MNKNNDKHKPGQGECLCKHRLCVHTKAACPRWTIARMLLPAIVLASMGCGYHIVPASMGFVITTPACGMCHIRLLRRAPNPYAAKRDEER